MAGIRTLTMIKFTNTLEKDFTCTPSKYPQKTFKDKSCKWCDAMFKPQGPSHHYCSDQCRKQVYSDKHYKRSYGVSREWVLTKIKEQNGVCAICKSYGFKMRDDHVTGMNLDHDHKTGKARGLLCHNCNRGLGLFQDSEELLESARRYLNDSRRDEKVI
jgi:hypothetical protein